MPLLSHLFYTAVLMVGSCSAAPRQGRTFSVSQQLVNPGYRLHGAHQMLKTHAKFGKTPLERVVATVQSSSGPVVATPVDAFDGEYLCLVTMDFDTGLSDLWAFSSFQPSSQSSGHRLYQPSSTAKQLNGYTWSIRYGDGSQAAGVVYTDAVTIGGVTYASQAVEADTSVSSQLVSNRADGFVGLAFNNDNQVKPIQQKTFLSGISPSLQSPTMVANLKYHGPGTYDFGYINSSRYTGSITYTNVNPSSGFWQIAVSGYGSSPFNAIVDTGSSLIYLPSAILSAYYSKVSGAQNSNVYGGWVVPCGATLSNLSLRIGTFNAVVPGKYIVYGPVGGGSFTCYAGLQDGSNLGFAILGDIFIKSNMVVFDNSASPRIGLAVPANLP